MLSQFIADVINHNYGEVTQVPVIKINPKVVDSMIDEDNDHAFMTLRPTSFYGIKLQETDEVETWEIVY